MARFEAGPAFNSEELSPETPEISDAERLESYLRGKSEKILSRGAGIGGECASIAAEHPELETEAGVIVEGINKFMQRAKKVISITALSAACLVGAGGSIEGLKYANSRYEVTETKDKEGNPIFQHEDAETTQILDYLSGKADIPASVKRQVELKKVKSYASMAKMPLPADIEKADEEKLSAFIDSAVEEILRTAHIYEKTSKGELRRLVAPISRFRKNSALYQALWKIEKEAGNPKIRMDLDISWAPEKRAYYESSTNTMHISLPETGRFVKDKDPNSYIVDDFLAEASHGKQWNEAFVKSDIRHFITGLAVSQKVVKENKTPRQVYDETQYSTPGTIEYEAHKEIEPKLKKLFTERYQQEKARISKQRSKSPRNVLNKINRSRGPR